MSSVKCAVFPVAGLGTRFLPATKSVAKELLPVVDRPIIQYAVAECLEAGIERIVLVTSRFKTSLIDHFERDVQLERLLETSAKLEQLQLVRSILPEKIQLIHVRQAQPLGLGHAVLCARSLVGDEPFAVVLPDDLLVPHNGGVSPALRDMSEYCDRSGHSVVAVEKVAADRVDQYGIVDPGEQLEPGCFQVNDLVEKPSVGQAPSQLGIVGRYILKPEIFARLEQAESMHRPEGGELQLTDSIQALLPDVSAWQLECDRYDCGSKVGFLRANLAAAAKDPDLRAELQQFAESYIQKGGRTD